MSGDVYIGDVVKIDDGIGLVGNVGEGNKVMD